MDHWPNTNNISGNGGLSTTNNHPDSQLDHYNQYEYNLPLPIDLIDEALQQQNITSPYSICTKRNYIT